MGAGLNFLGAAAIGAGIALYLSAGESNKIATAKNVVSNAFQAGADALDTAPSTAEYQQAPTVAADQLRGSGKIGILSGAFRPLDYADTAQQSHLGSIFTFTVERVERRGPDTTVVAGYSRHPNVNSCDSLLNVDGKIMTVGTAIRNFDPNLGCWNIDN